MVNGEVAWKLKMLVRVYAGPEAPCSILVKLPTAYMMPPHCTSYRTCSVVPFGYSCGVPLAGVEDTDADAAPASPATASGAAPVISRARGARPQNP
jgi:hypothetical protein